MCERHDCKMICIYELDDDGNKIFVHYDTDLKPLWIELTKDGVSLGTFYPK